MNREIISDLPPTQSRVVLAQELLTVFASPGDYEPNAPEELAAGLLMECSLAEGGLRSGIKEVFEKQLVGVGCETERARHIADIAINQTFLRKVAADPEYFGCELARYEPKKKSRDSSKNIFDFL